MIRFQDTVEKKDNPELLSSTAFRDIKPSGTMSTEEAASFLDSLFSADLDSQDIYNVEDESLLAEIFGRYEDEFDFDFEFDDEIQSALDCFDSDKWERLSDKERKAAIQDLAAVIGKKLEVKDNLDIQFYDGHDGSYGAYLPGSNTIEVNQNTLYDSREIVDTVAHEMRHAYQHQRAQCQETLQDKMYQLNFENYISPISLADGKYLFFTDYQDQLVEAEARAFANIFTYREAE